ncbi:unnamed protein product [Darwinula stevensoni]|uniref:PH domain-containing protein n=1 Tax=Darwinula stevensoni TaxID=69355 RepID=A0A7R8X5Y6_9CRUS|nr:unnamed protein product [Darwinula stevensoni]CAG0887588.1 unnamed protein product [Darwinula stevensoni]
MGNKISCSCAPLIKRAYRYEDSPWAVTRRREGHLLRFTVLLPKSEDARALAILLWAEVFHVSSTGSGQFKWQQVSEDLVPVNITCIQDSPDAIFHITAYNPQVDKILDVRLVQPGTKIGQASECFVYWKDPMTGDTWGLNFTSPLDARQFRECCSPSFKFSRKASSSYSLKMEAPRHRKNSSRRHAQSTPSSPSKAGLDREPQCTCMTPEQQARYRAAQGFHSMSHRTLPLAPRSQIMADYYDQLDHRSGSRMSLDHEMDRRRGNGLQRRELTATKSVDYSEMESVREGFQSRRNKSKSTDDVSQLRFDSNTLKRMLQPMGSLDSPVTSPECPRRGSAQRPSRLDGFLSEPESSLARMKRESSFLDSNCYATTPSSSNGGGNSDAENPLGSPNAKLLKEYEAHLRSTLAQGLEAESISLNTFEALISQSMDNLAQSCRSLPSTSASARRTPRPMSAGPLRYPSGQRLDRGYVSDHWDSRQHRRSGYGSDLRGSGYLSDHRPLLSTSRDLSHQPSSVESTDSRICYLTSSEISDDERLSLTTALSDDEDMGNPMGNRSGIPAASFSCTGAVRKAGFLSVKKWLLRKKHRIELARKRGWKGYWVCLKGTTMLFYPCDSSEDSSNEAGQRGNNVEASPRHLIIVDGAILQPIPEHPKREYIFCLSTAFGDAYLFQAPCQVELENWIQSIHGACAAAFARHRGKTGTLHLLKEEVLRLEKAIESDRKLKHMAELQLSVVSDADSKYQIQSQINQWEENLERLRCEQFRLRCYMASLEGSELPNPKNLLTNVSRGTKLTLNRLGVFTVSSLHAYICARSPSLLSNLLAGRGATKRRPYVHTLSRSNSGSSKRSFQIEPGESSVGKTSFKVYTVPLPNNQVRFFMFLPSYQERSYVVSLRPEFMMHALHDIQTFHYYNFMDLPVRGISHRTLKKSCHSMAFPPVDP